MDDAVTQGFVTPPQRALLEVSDDPAALLDRIAALARLAALARKATEADDYRAI